VSVYYLALYRLREDHTHHNEDDPIAVVNVPLEADVEPYITVRLRLAADTLADWLAQHGEVFL
jgi:hypothetical protein